MAEIIPMTEEQKFQLEIYKLVMNQNAAAEEAFQFIGTDELKLELFKIHFQSGGANSDITTRTIEAVRKSKEALDLFTTKAESAPVGDPIRNPYRQLRRSDQDTRTDDT